MGQMFNNLMANVVRQNQGQNSMSLPNSTALPVRTPASMDTGAGQVPPDAREAIMKMMRDNLSRMGTSPGRTNAAQNFMDFYNWAAKNPVAPYGNSAPIHMAMNAYDNIVGKNIIPAPIVNATPADLSQPPASVPPPMPSMPSTTNLLSDTSAKPDEEDEDSGIWGSMAKLLMK